MLRLKKHIQWLKKGESSIIIYLSFSMLAVVATVLLTQSIRISRDVTGTQLLSDMAADGAAAQNNTGWGFDGIDEEKNMSKAGAYAKLLDTAENVKNLNEGLLNQDSAVDMLTVNYSVIKEGQANVNIGTQGTSSTTLLPDFSVYRDSNTALSYNAGMKIVMDAYMYSENAYESGYPIYDPMLRDAGHKWTQYVWAAGRSIGPDSFPFYADCSGFVYAIFKKNGYTLGIWTGAMQEQGIQVSEDEARPGDIVLYFRPGNPVSYHVGIYAGKNKAGVPIEIDCTNARGDSHSCTVSNPGRGVRVSTVANAAHGNAVQYRRVIKSNGRATKVKEYGDDSLAGVLFALLDGSNLTFTAACGIMGNMEAESGFRSYVWNGNPASDDEMKQYALELSGGTADEFEMELGRPGWRTDGGFGLCQWTNSSVKSGGRDGRKTKLFHFAEERGLLKDAETIQQTGGLTNRYMQIAFVLNELSQPGYQWLVDYMNRQKGEAGAREAARAFYMVFEAGRSLNSVPPDSSGPRRMANAAKQYSNMSKLTQFS